VGFEELERWLSSAEAAERLGVSQYWATKMGERGALRGVKTRIGWLFDPASVEEEARRRVTRSELLDRKVGKGLGGMRSRLLEGDLTPREALKGAHELYPLLDEELREDQRAELASMILDLIGRAREDVARRASLAGVPVECGEAAVPTDPEPAGIKDPRRPGKKKPPKEHKPHGRKGGGPARKARHE
jgi:hypothetical protein